MALWQGPTSRGIWPTPYLWLNDQVRGIDLGFWYGRGYCPFTEWHWQVRSRLGFVDPPSYIQLLIREVTGIAPGARTADALALGGLAAATVLGVTLSLRDRRRPIDQ
jgi:hypothetical protein